MREWVLKRYVYVYIVGRASLLRMETKGLRERVVAENGWCFGWVSSIRKSSSVARDFS